MDPTHRANMFDTTGEAYDQFMGRYSRLLAIPFAEAAGVRGGQRALDVGCGPGALTGELVRRVGAARVCAIDPTAPFVDACQARHPGVEVVVGRSESIPFGDDVFDVALAQLVFHFIADAPAAAAEMRRTVRSGGTVAACVWDFAEGMELLRLFWDAALAIDPAAPDEARTLRFGRERELVELFDGVGLVDANEVMLEVQSAYRDFEELWAGFLAGIGPAGSYCCAQPEARRGQLRAELFERLGSPTGGFTLAAKARCAVAHVP